MSLETHLIFIFVFDCGLSVYVPQSALLHLSHGLGLKSETFVRFITSANRELVEQFLYTPSSLIKISK